VYTQIATHWFCPPEITPAAYKAEIQGHYTTDANGRKIAAHGARKHYDDYAIGNDLCTNHDGRVGIRLGTIPNLIPISIGQTIPPTPVMPAAVSNIPAIEPTPNELLVQPVELMPITSSNTPPIDPSAATVTTTTTTTKKAGTKRPPLSTEDLDQMVAIMQALGITGSVPEVFHQLIDRLSSNPNLLQPPAEDPATVATCRSNAAMENPATVETATESPHDRNISWFISEIEILRERIEELESEMGFDRPKTGSSTDGDLDQELATVRSELERVLTENARLSAENEGLESRLAGIGSFLGHDLSLAPKSTATIQTQPVAPAGSAKRSVTIASVPQPSVKTASNSDTPLAELSTEEKVDRIITAWIEWNCEQPSLNSRARISAMGLKSIGKLVGATYQPVVDEVFALRAAEIAQHHTDLAISPRHNAKKEVDTDSILQSISREKLRLDNWQDVRSR
jgi:hypothetical protein